MRRITEEAKAIMTCFDTQEKPVIIRYLQMNLSDEMEHEISEMLAELLTFLEECSDAEYLELLNSISIDQEEFDVEQARKKYTGLPFQKGVEVLIFCVYGCVNA